MKHALKIFGISLGGIVGLILLIISLALWVVFTPERLTPIVRNVAKDFVKCEHEIGKVELTFFSTFPHFGLAIDTVVIVNATEGAPNDTVVYIPELLASIDVKAFLKEKELSIPMLSMPDIRANIYVDADGKTNYDVLLMPNDTLTTEDTTAIVLPFEQIVVEELALSANLLQYVSIHDSMDVCLHNVEVNAEVKSWEDILLAICVDGIDATIGATTYAEGLKVNASIPMGLNLDKMGVALYDAHLAVNALDVALNGWAEIGDTIQTDMRVMLNEWQMDSVISILPFVLPKDIVQLVKGGDVSLDATAKINMEDGCASVVDIHKLSVNVKHSAIAARGEVKDPLGQLWIDVAANVDVKVADVKAFVPDGLQVEGGVKGQFKAQMYLDDLMAMDLHKGKICGDLQLKDINYNADGIMASLPDNRLAFEIPNARPSRKEVDWLGATLHISEGQVEMSMPLQAEFGEIDLAVEINNVLGSSPYLQATLSAQSKTQVHAVMDSMDMTMSKPNIDAYIAYHMNDTNVMPIVEASVAFERLYGYYTDIKADIQSSTLSAELKAPRLKATLHSNAMVAQMENVMDVKTDEIGIVAAARYSKRGGNNLLLKWNPQLSINMQNAFVDIEGWKEDIKIPEIAFEYTNKDCKIEQSKIIVGNSDFALTGELRNIGRWMRHRGVLEGELNFVSEQTDADQLLALLSAEQGTEEAEKVDNPSEKKEVIEEGQEKRETEPFLVPKDVDLVLNTKIKRASFFNQTATELGGRIYVKDGALVLEEMGFICNAAKLQLTAMYRTPRRNHIYVGFDYHMVDVNIQELIGMIPQIDSMMPMLRSFKGNAEFHLAVETYTNAQYEIKPSTLRGAASIYGKDLVVLDNETFSTISKLLLFSKKTENKVDSISAEMTLYKKEIDIYPFCVSIDNYMVALGGRHNLDMTFNYDINVLSPIYLGVNVSGNFDDLKIKLAPCKFAKDFKPLFHRKVDIQSAELRSMIRESMRKNVKM